MIQVLDKGYVALVDHMGNDMSVVRAARVSHNAVPRNDGSDEKLIHYLMRHKHTSPFEHVVFTFEVKAPIFVFREWHRHRTWSYNEMSARYTPLPAEWYVPSPERIQGQSESNKQASDGQQFAYAEDWAMVFDNSQKESYYMYENAMNAGMAREIARINMSVGMYSKMFATVDLWNLFHFLNLRLHPHAQWEIQQYAQALLSLVEPIVPTSVAAWRDNSPIRL